MSVQFPPYARMALGSFQEKPSSNMTRTSMDRGVPKQRRVQSDVLVSLSFDVVFLSNQAASDFRAWYYGDAGAGTVWFDWRDPRTNQVRNVRVVAGSLGALAPAGPFSIGVSRRSIQLEYLELL